MTLSEDEQRFLLRAIELARDKSQDGQCGPFGAVIVKDQQIIAEGWNRVVDSYDPTAHAEVVAIRKACAKLGTNVLAGCVMYSSCEPCPMCFSAAVWARLEKIVFAETREGAAAAGFDDHRLYAALKNPEQQSLITCIHQPDESAAKVFEFWKSNPRKIMY